MQLQPEVAISQQATLWQEAKPTEHVVKRAAVGAWHLTPVKTEIHACAKHPWQHVGRVEACLDKCDGVGGQQLPEGGGHLLSLSSPIQQLVQQRLEDKTLVAVYEGDLQRQGMQRATATAHRGLDLKKLQAMQAAAKGKR